MKRVFLALIAAIVLLTCNDTEITPRQYPRIRTLEVFNVNQDGASFKGEIYFSSVGIVDHGFLISETKNPTIGSAEKISLGEKTSIGDFTSIIDRSLITGREYFMRAYAKSADYTVYGEVIGFTSLGSKAPTLKNIFPNEGTWRDTVYLIGENFSERPGIMEVKFGTNKLSYFPISADSLLVIIPLQLINKMSDVSLKFDDATTLIEEGFTLYSPAITSIVPEHVILGETITITGNNFNPSFSSARVNGVEAAIVSRSTTSIQAKIPTSLSTGTAEAFVYIGSELISNSIEIQIDGLQVLGIEPETGTFGDVIKISGERFGNSTESLSVFFGGYRVDIISLTDTEIQIQVPDNYNMPSAIISIQNNLNQNGTAPQTFVMKSPIVESAIGQIENGENTIIINGKYFWPSNPEYPYNNPLQVYLGSKKMDILSSSTTEIKVLRNSIPTLNTEELTVVVAQNEAMNKPLVKFPWTADNNSYREYAVGTISFEWSDEAYLGLGMIGSNLNSSKLWKFDPINNTWTQITNTPGLSRRNASSFVHNNKGYVFGGFGVFNFRFNDYWGYDRATGSWEKLGDFPVITNTYWRGFELNDVFYAMEVNSISGESRLWYLNDQNDQWVFKYDLPFTYNYTKEISVNINNKHYLRGGDNLWIYDSTLDQWSDLGEFPFLDTTSFLAKKLNDALFCVNTTTRESYEYTPSTNSWIRKSYFYSENSGYSSFSLGGKFYLHAGNSLYEYNPAYEN